MAYIRTVKQSGMTNQWCLDDNDTSKEEFRISAQRMLVL